MPDSNIVPPSLVGPPLRSTGVAAFGGPCRGDQWLPALRGRGAGGFTALSAGSETILGRISLVIGAVMAPVMVFLALGGFLAVRWVDRNGGWK